MIKLSDEELILITQLSDKKGHTKTELKNSKTIRLKPNRLRKILHRLEKGFEDPLRILGKLIFFGDIKDPYLLAMKFLCGKDPFSRFIQGRLDEKTKDLLNNCDDKIELRYLMESILDNLVKSVDFYNEPQLLAKLKISGKTAAHMEKKPIGEMKYHLNKMILEDAYPNEIIKRRKSIVRRELFQGLGEKGGGEKYYLNENLSVFRLIVINFNTISRDLKIWKSDFNINIQKDYVELLINTEISPENFDKAKEAYVSQHEKEDELNRTYEEFLKSNYIISLLKEFGFSPVYDIMKSMGAERSKIWLIIELAHEQNIISDEDFMKKRTIKEMLDSNSNSKI